jgi:hypothetical protein
MTPRESLLLKRMIIRSGRIPEAGGRRGGAGERLDEP